ncbi:hypothetical protein HK101_000812 [Irineochytrium annulatum]|nr:hypothetical protein HK101_000812 [Irineochytrium annulatum]
MIFGSDFDQNALLTPFAFSNPTACSAASLPFNVALIASLAALAVVVALVGLVVAAFVVRRRGAREKGKANQDSDRYHDASTFAQTPPTSAAEHAPLPIEAEKADDAIAVPATASKASGTLFGPRVGTVGGSLHLRPDVIDKFKAGSIDGPKLLTLTDDEMRSRLGLTSRGQRDSIRFAIRKFGGGGRVGDGMEDNVDDPVPPPYQADAAGIDSVVA